MIELTADGTDYLSHGAFVDDAFQDNWLVLRAVLEQARCALNRQQLLDAWPPEEPKPCKATLWKWLDRAVAQGLACRDGDGHRNNPFYYWLPGQLEHWQADPLSRLYLAQLDDLRRLQGPFPPGPPRGAGSGAEGSWGIAPRGRWPGFGRRIGCRGHRRRR